jgi:hypothetical protein
MGNLRELKYGQLFVVRAMLWFVVTYEITALTEPSKICVPIQKVMEDCSFQLVMCPCGFYTLAERHFIQHLRGYHPIAKEIYQ